MKVLITGGAGFIGSHLAEYHLKKGDEVCVIDNLSTGFKENLEPFEGLDNFRFILSDLLNCPELFDEVANSDRIYHMAAVVGVFEVLKKPLEVLETNIFATQRLLEAVKESKCKPRILIASTSEVYGPSRTNEMKEGDPAVMEGENNCRWNYPVSKLVDEAFGLSYYHAFDVPITVLRLFNTIGLRQRGRYGMVVPRFVEKSIAGEPIVVFGRGEQTRSFCDARDMVAMLDQIADTPKAIGEILNVGNDAEITINKLAEKVKLLSNSESLIKHVSYEEVYGEGHIETFKRYPDLSKLYQLISYRPKWSLDDTILSLIKGKEELPK